MTEYFKDTLPNGLRVVTTEMPHLHSAEMACFVGVGGRDEDPVSAGVSHFLEHILFRGTADYPTSFELERAFEAIGGAVNASTDAETTCFHSRFHPSHLRRGSALFASMLIRPLFSDVDLERKIVLEEALEDLNEKGEDISPDNLTAALLWPGHPLSLPTIGTRESIARIGSADLRRHHDRFYRPANTVIAVAGKVRRDETLTAVEAAFGPWQGALPRPTFPQALPESAPGTEACWVKESDSQVNVQLALPTSGRNEGGTASLRVLRSILSWGGASRLMLRLRETLGLTYSVEANLSLFADCGCFTVDMAVAPKNLLRAVEETLAVLEELRRKPVPEEELEGVVRSFLFDLEFSRDHTEAMTNRFGWGELVGYRRTVETDRREIAAVTPADLMEAARRLFRPDALKAAVIGPFGAKDRGRVEALLEGAFR